MANIIERTRAAIATFRHGPPQVKASPFFWPAWREDMPQWQMIDVQTYIDEGFNLNALIYSAIMYKVRAMTAAPLRAYTGELDHPELLDANRPLARLVARPNPHQSWVEQHGQNVVYLNVSGNAYIFLDRPRPTGLPKAMYSLRPDRTFIVPANIDGKAQLAGYLYVPEGRNAYARMNTAQRWEAIERGQVIPIPVENMIHVKLPNPADPLEGMGYGLSPISPAARSTDLDNAITDYINKFFKHGGVPPILFSFADAVDDNTLAYLRENISERFGGYDNWIKPLVLDKGGSVSNIGLTFDEMGAPGMDQRNETRILGPQGVPAILVGAQVGLENATYSNLNGLRRLFWEDTMVPESKLFEVEFKYYLNDDSGSEWVAFDYSKVPALQEDLVPLVEAAFKLWSMGKPAYMALEAVGLPVERSDGDDVGYLPLNVMPIGAPTPESQQDEGGAASSDSEARAKALALGEGMRKNVRLAA